MNGIKSFRGGMTEAEIKSFTQDVIANARPTMRRVIGDRTPRQYDRADEMSEGIARAVRQALVNVGLATEEAA